VCVHNLESDALGADKEDHAEGRRGGEGGTGNADRDMCVKMANPPFSF